MRNLIAGALFGACAIAAPVALRAETSGADAYAEAGQVTAEIADAYFAAYIGRDWDTLETLITDQTDFRDPTATHVFGDITSEGSAAMMKRFREGYSNLTHMEFAATRRLVSGNVALYEGELTWGLDLGDGTIVDSTTPMVIVLTVEGSKVIHHRDYLDYAPFVAAVEEARGKAE